MAVPPTDPFPSPPPSAAGRRRWRYYRTTEGADPVRQYLESLARADRAVLKAQMQRVRDDPRAARHVAGAIYEVRASRQGRAHRVLFVREGRSKQILLAVDAFAKTSQRTPVARLRLAVRRSDDWRQRGRSLATRAPVPGMGRPGLERGLGR